MVEAQLDAALASSWRLQSLGVSADELRNLVQFVVKSVLEIGSINLSLFTLESPKSIGVP